MAHPKKFIPLAAILTAAFLYWLFRPFFPNRSWTNITSQLSVLQDHLQTTQGSKYSFLPEASREKVQSPFVPGIPKAIGEPYSKMLVVPRTTEEDVDWIYENFANDPYMNYSIYTVDDEESELHPPRNKGHEVMVYISYIIDNYNNLSDVNIFMHSHQFSWHNDDLLDNDAVQMISRLSSERVQREGYMNMRCHWHPGCPSWMHPGNVEEDINKQEEVMLAKAWSELFPLDPVPDILAQPCCAQFALSRERIQNLPLARYVFYRDWLLRTELSDYISGRVWEYLWQFVFTGNTIVCPAENICYCDGFGVCFGSELNYSEFMTRRGEVERLEEELSEWYNRMDTVRDFLKDDKLNEAAEIGMPEAGKDIELAAQIRDTKEWVEKRLQEAKEHGNVAMNRAIEAGRPWQDGDGF